MLSLFVCPACGERATLERWSPVDELHHSHRDCPGCERRFEVAHLRPVLVPEREPA